MKRVHNIFFYSILPIIFIIIYLDIPTFLSFLTTLSPSLPPLYSFPFPSLPNKPFPFSTFLAFRSPSLLSQQPSYLFYLPCIPFPSLFFLTTFSTSLPSLHSVPLPSLPNNLTTLPYLPSLPDLLSSLPENLSPPDINFPFSTFLAFLSVTFYLFHHVEILFVFTLQISNLDCFNFHI